VKHFYRKKKSFSSRRKKISSKSKKTREKFVYRILGFVPLQREIIREGAHSRTKGFLADEEISHIEKLLLTFTYQKRETKQESKTKFNH